jgi:hypothetical protein
MLDNIHPASNIQNPASSEPASSMSEILFQYEPVMPTTWAYLASLLMIALYFKFNRVLSLRNWDLAGVILLAPALLMVQFSMHRAEGDNAARLVQHIGYIWLFSVSGLFLLRLLFDAFMVRRPLLEPNLSAGGLIFLGISLFVFLMANVVTETPSPTDLVDSQRAERLQNMAASNKDLNTLQTHGPGFPLLYLLPRMSIDAVLGELGEQERFVSGKPVLLVHVVTARTMAICAQLAIVVALVLVGMRHFDNIKTGIAVATLYLLLPYTAMWTGSVTHALPGALLMWAVVMYRRPLVAGALVGLAFGTIYYPVLLLPLWISFYWQRGATRFLIGLAAAIGLLLLVLAVTSFEMPMFLAGLRQMLGLWPVVDADSGVWGEFWRPAYRYPILAAHIGLCLSMALWPAQKNLGTLISYTAAVMLATQFWHAHSGGLALAWYLPLLLLTIFRPNLEDRVALAVVK